MKPLTTEQQEQAIELIERVANDEPKDYYYESAKDFLQSLKPKVYVCNNNHGSMFFFSKSVLNEDFVITESDAHIFNSIEDAREILDSIQKDDGIKYFILTE